MTVCECRFYSAHIMRTVTRDHPYTGGMTVAAFKESQIELGRPPVGAQGVAARIACIVAVAVLVAAACGSSKSTASGPPPTEPTTVAPTTTTVPPTPAVDITEKDFNIAPA